MAYFDPRGGSNRYSIKTDFFQKWSNEMAYVLGFLYADGSIIDAVSSRTQYIKFDSKDKDIINSIKLLLRSKHPIHSRPPRETLHRNGIYKSLELFSLSIGSRRMFADLIKIGLMPNKSKIIKFPVNIPKKYLSHFIRGYFDGDGCVHIQKAKGKKQKIILKGLSVIFTSGSKIFLQGLISNLQKIITLKHDKVYDSNRAYQLRYSTFDSIQLFKVLYKNTFQDIYLKRKFEIFLKYFQLRPLRVDKDVKKIFKNLKVATYPSR